jgi:hypothetical protein
MQPARTSPFAPCTPEEIRLEAERRLEEARRAAQGPDYRHYVVAGCLALNAFLALLIPVAGPFLCIGLLLGAAWVIFRGPFAPAPIRLDPRDVDEESSRLGWLVKGDCPGCRQPITLTIRQDPSDTECPVCRGRLRYQRGHVGPR